MKIVSLLTDFGDQDGFVGTMKGVILSINPSVQLVDISHKIPAHNIDIGAYVLHSAYTYFPHGTIHVAVVDPGVGSNRNIVICEANEQFFIAPDNGILKFVYEKFNIEKVINVTNSVYFLSEISQTFHGRDIFAPVAGHLSVHQIPAMFGAETTTFEKGKIPKLNWGDHSIEGEIVYIDKFGNLISNITQSEFIRLCRSRNIAIEIKDVYLQKIHKSYEDGEHLTPLALWGSGGTLEVAIKQASAAKILNVEIGENIRLRWF